MVKSPPFLSICIPTYNRPIELSETLRILGEQLDSLGVSEREQIEIIVSDNNSESDNISPIFDEWARSRPDSRLHIQASNVGPTLNFEYCYRSSLGQFVFILSDDDHLVQGALSLMLTALKNDNPDILFLPFFTIPGSIQEKTPDRSQLERNVFLRQTGVLPTLISACIFKRTQIEPCFGRYLHTNMHHFHYFLHVLEMGEQFVYLNRQILFSPYEGNSGGYNWFNAFAGDFFQIIDEFPCDRIDRKCLHKIKREMFVKRIIPTYVNRKISGYTINKKFTSTSNFEIIQLVSKRSWNLAAYWLIFLPVVATPKIALKFLKRRYLSIRKIYTKIKESNV